MPPSVAFVASAWESWGPGLSGNLKGNAVARTGVCAVELVVAEPAVGDGVVVELGAPAAPDGAAPAVAGVEVGGGAAPGAAW
ncbi:MAG: hypothetical protein QOF86_2225, partial [Baekduia sp.]|nr:hypothetical protein [Baekduia sp.]